MVALTSVVGATVVLKGASPVVAVLLTVLAGGLLGLLNGTAIAGLRMLPFIVTPGMMGVARGRAKWMGNNQTVNYPDSPINRIMALNAPDKLLPLPAGVWLVIALAVVMAVVMRHTVFGRYYLRHRLERNRGKACRHSCALAKAGDLLACRIVYRRRRIDATLAVQSGRPDRGHRAGVGRHRRSSDWWRELERRER